MKFVKEGFELSEIKSISNFYPFNLMLGLLNYKALSINERISLLKLFLKLPFLSSDKFSTITIREWLESERQSC
ncbi:MAG: hypothetical protein DYG97_02375 [Ignavibacteria bacterium CHB3]|nr:hypothetical protein [Ignavibacteria bacterium CHB3]